MVVFGAALGAAGCSSSPCEESCEVAQECFPNSALILSIDCSDACDMQEDQMEAIGCLDQWDAYNACLAESVNDSCGPTGKTCEAETAAYDSCVSAAL